MSMIGIMLEINYYVNYTDVIAAGVFIILAVPVIFLYLINKFYIWMCDIRKKRRERKEE